MEFVNVIVDISHEKLDRIFQYHVPEELKDRLQIGMKVNVPFGKGNRLMKGYVVGFADEVDDPPERIKELLLSEGYSDALINAGNSSIAAIGSAPGCDDWSIGTPAGNIALRNDALSISGLHTDGSAHIVNPLTGQYSTGTPVVVSGPEADVAEILSTALFAAPPPERPAILANFPEYTML